jgi:hypothetical protein
VDECGVLGEIPTRHAHTTAWGKSEAQLCVPRYLGGLVERGSLAGARPRGRTASTFPRVEFCPSSGLRGIFSRVGTQEKSFKVTKKNLNGS